MTLPIDIARIRHDWTRREVDAWTSETFRAPVLVWLNQFLENHGWAESISVEEKFHAPGLHRRVPYGPTQRASDPRTLEEGFRQSDALPVLVFTALRAADQAEVEVAIAFPAGATTDLISIDYYLDRANESIETFEAKLPFV